MSVLDYAVVTEKEDLRLNQRIISMFTFGTIGLGLGTLVSLLFKNKARIRAIGVGFGAGASHDYFQGDLFHKRYHNIHGYHCH